MQEKNKKRISKGSVAVFALILMFILVVATIGVIATATLERKMSISTGNSTTAFQVAETGMERTLQFFKSNFGGAVSTVGANIPRNNILAPTSSNPSCVANNVCCILNSISATNDNEIRFKTNDQGTNCGYATCTDTISSVKIIKSIGTTKTETRAIEEDVFLGATKLLLHFNGMKDGKFEDSSFYYSNRNPIDTVGDVKDSTEEVMFNSAASAYFDGVGDYLSVGDSNDWNFGTGDFTIDFWINSTNTIRQHALSFGQTSVKNMDFVFDHGGYGIWVYWNGGGTPYIRAGVTGDYTNGIWHHIALVRKKTTTTNILTLYVDGKSVGTKSYLLDINLSGDGVPHSIGALGTSAAFWKGYIDELRISKGLARWTTDFSDKLPSTEYWAD